MQEPERLIDAVITDMERRLTEARLQVLAAEIAGQRLRHAGEPTDGEAGADARELLGEMESTLRDLRSRRDQLVARVRDADARLAIERSLMEVDGRSGSVALEMLSERAIDSEAQTAAIQEIRKTTSPPGDAHDG